jgi:hypothetical protein
MIRANRLRLTMASRGCELAEDAKAPSTADRALLRAFRAWGMGEFSRTSERFSPAWRDQLQSGWEPANQVSSGDAWSELRREHGASARPDPERVHSSWFVRALKGESDAVKLAVTAHATPSLRQALLRGLNVDPEQLTPDFPPDPEALGWAMALWAERLVGALPEDDDPPVIVAVTRLSSLDLSRLIKVCGLAKHAFALDGPRTTRADESLARFSPIDRVRLGFFRRRLGQPDARLVPLAKDDLQYIDRDHRRAHLRLGLVTFGRLLEASEVHRARWATQHLPYSVAKLVRRKFPLPMPRRAVFAWESWVLEAAWARLLGEKRMSGGRDWLPVVEEGDES